MWRIYLHYPFVCLTKNSILSTMDQFIWRLFFFYLELNTQKSEQNKVVEYHCTLQGCTKSFRKQHLLDYHLKYFHSTKPIPKRSRSSGNQSNKSWKFLLFFWRFFQVVRACALSIIFQFIYIVDWTNTNKY